MKPSSCAVAALLVGLAGGSAALLPPLPVPSLLAPPGESLRLRVAARGVQIYVCRREAGGPAAWEFVQPEAALVDDSGAPFASQGAGPSWQAKDGGRIVGTVVAKVDAPGGDVIAWLLLRARPSGGPGPLAGVISVQRIHTEGGAAPQGGCSDATLGRIERVRYTAEYTLFQDAP